MQKWMLRADSRGKADHGWLKSKHSFSFASWYHPDFLQFGALRVLNDDWVAPGMGFSTHPHRDMEIISIPLEGSMRHKDSLGHTEVLHTGEVQVMSAGTGIAHSEMNNSMKDPLSFLQIWILPRTHGVEPRYENVRLEEAKMKNALLQILSPFPEDDGAWIHQDAWMYLTRMEAEQAMDYHLHVDSHGVFVMVIEGSITIEGEILNERDALALSETKKVAFFAEREAFVLLIEVPLNL
jgi:hypothetical protein